jgi:hypothetical protein
MGVAGLLTFVVATVRWQRTGFGQLAIETMRLPLFGMVLLVAGAQVIGSSFMLSLTRIGDQ